MCAVNEHLFLSCGSRNEPCPASRRACVSWQIGANQRFMLGWSITRGDHSAYEPNDFPLYRVEKLMSFAASSGDDSMDDQSPPHISAPNITVRSPGHFLGHHYTRNRLQSDF
ncbi:hypothetical protein AB6A40_001971 [Gnathostoma spinigerum]|uniref:Uncharacterized protein n=1 Tax=Gnathostoma spinigerum TaxID=75299 RepID=A0ABD6EFF2_9BILA